MNTLHNYWYDYIERCKQSSFGLDCDTYPAATSQEIQTLEQHYDMALPASYKALLEVTNGLDFFSLGGSAFYPISQVKPFIHETEILDLRNIWHEQLEDKKGEYQFFSEDLDFFYNRHLDIVNREGKKVTYPPPISKNYLFSNKGEIVDINGEPYRNPPTNAIIRNSQTLARMQDKAVLFKYSDYQYLIRVGWIDDATTYYSFNPNSEPQKGEAEAWLIRFDDSVSDSDFCLKFLNFIELAEFTLMEYGGPITD